MGLATSSFFENSTTRSLDERPASVSRCDEAFRWDTTACVGEKGVADVRAKLRSVWLPAGTGVKYSHESRRDLRRDVLRGIVDAH